MWLEPSSVNSKPPPLLASLLEFAYTIGIFIGLFTDFTSLNVPSPIQFSISINKNLIILFNPDSAFYHMLWSKINIWRSFIKFTTNIINSTKTLRHIAFIICHNSSDSVTTYHDFYTQKLTTLNFLRQNSFNTRLSLILNHRENRSCYNVIRKEEYKHNPLQTSLLQLPPPHR